MLKHYHHRVINAELPARTLERRLNRWADQGYAILAVSSQGKLIIMVKEKT
jgi:hypothetical protein